ncbi:MAG: hypothetical protein ACYC36_16330 [Bellilinea sp.]
MTRQQSVWYGALIVMLMIGIWRFVTAALAAQNRWWAPVFLPILFAAAGAGLILYGWQAAVSGPFVLAGALLGMSATFTLHSLFPGGSIWLTGLSLVPELAGAGMLIEISRGQGWRFTRRLSYGLMLTGMAMALVLAISSWQNTL